MSKPIEKFHSIDEITPANPDKPFTGITIGGDEVMSVNPESSWKVDRIYTDYAPKNEHKELIVVFKRKEGTMSGIYIPGMEMPQNCEECDVKVVCKNYWKIIREQHTRPAWCPLIPVPEHGRLIDADVLFDFILNIYKNAQGEARKAYGDILDVIVATGDVIPAEGLTDG